MEDIIQRHAGSYNPAFIWGLEHVGRWKQTKTPAGGEAPGAEGTAFSSDVVTRTRRPAQH